MITGIGISPFIKRHISGGGHTPPVPAPIGQFLNDNFNLFDYDSNNVDISNPTPTTLRINGAEGGITSFQTAWDLSYGTTCRDKVVYECTYTLNDIQPKVWGFGPSFIQYDAGGADYVSAMAGHGALQGRIYLFQGGGALINVYEPTLALANIGDVFNIKLTIDVNEYRVDVVNVTKGTYGFGTKTGDYDFFGASVVNKVLSYYGYRTFGGDYTITQRKASTSEYKYCDILFVSDSKGEGSFCGPVANKAIEMLKADNPTLQIVSNSGVTDHIDRINTKLPELLFYKAVEVWIMTGSNDVRYSVVNYQDKYDAFIAQHVANGSIVKILNCIAEGSGHVDVTPVNTYWASTGLPVTDLYTNSQTAGLLKAIYDSGDHFHPNPLYNTDELFPSMQATL